MAVINGTSGPDFLIGTPGDDTINGLAGDDLLAGLEGNDALNGGDGEDQLVGGTGNDTLDGGAGFDLADFSDATGGVTVSLALAGPQTIGGGLGTDTLTNIEGLVGGNFNDVLTGDAGDNFFFGLGGNDTIDGGAGEDAILYTEATSGITVNLSLAGAQAIGGGEGSDTLISIEDVIGSGFDDSITGNSGSNFLYGGDGNNSLFGLDGDDVLQGGLGADLFDGGAGFDFVSYANDGRNGGVRVDLSISGPQLVGYLSEDADTFVSIEGIVGSEGGDSLTGDSADNVLYGLDGHDELFGGYGGTDTLIGGQGDDRYIINHSDVTIVELPNEGTDLVLASVSMTLASDVENIRLVGGSNSLTATGNNLDNAMFTETNIATLYGLDGTDTFGGYFTWTGFGGEGNDWFNDTRGSNNTLDGGNGIDTADYSGHYSEGLTIDLSLAGPQTVHGPYEMDTLVSIENLVGAGGDDTLKGSAGDNILNGGAGNDTVSGSAGDDTLNGGTDIDTASYAGAAGGVSVSLLLAGAQAVGGGEGSDTLSGIESLEGSAFNDTLTGDNGVNTLSGGTGNDTLVGNNGNDTLIGGDGNDYVDGVGGHDNMQGGPGNDLYVVNTGQDVVTELGATGSAEGTSDSISTFVSMTLPSNVESVTQLGIGNTFEIGNTLDNLMIGNIGNNALAGGQGNDNIRGGPGNDTLSGNVGTDTVNYGDAAGPVTVNLTLTTPQVIGGGQGTDTLNTFENIIGSPFNDTLTGDGGRNVLTGRDGDDLLVGNSAIDTLMGGNGNDTLTGGTAGDSLTGNAGNDIFRYEAPDQGGDTVSDFTVGADKFNFVSANFGALAPGQLLSANFALDAPTDADDLFVFLTGSKTLTFDPDGNGATAAVNIATLSNGATLSNTDIAIVVT